MKDVSSKKIDQIYTKLLDRASTKTGEFSTVEITKDELKEFLIMVKKDRNKSRKLRQQINRDTQNVKEYPKVSKEILEESKEFVRNEMQDEHMYKFERVLTQLKKVKDVKFTECYEMYYRRRFRLVLNDLRIKTESILRKNR